MANIVKVRELNPRQRELSNVGGGQDRYIEYKNLFLNNIIIYDKRTNKPLAYPIARLIKNQLVEDGKVGYDMLTEQWARVSLEGKRNKDGYYTKIHFFLGNDENYVRSASYEAKKNGAYVIFAFEDTYALATLIKNACAEIDVIHRAKLQNIKACKHPYIVSVKDDEIQLSIETAIEQQQDGKPVIVVDKNLGEGLTSVKTEVPFIADKYDELEDHATYKLLNKLGTMSANIYKKERVQGEEVKSTLGQCLDYLFLMIDNFNAQCESYGIPLEMKDNSSLREYMEQKAQAQEGDGNDDEGSAKEGN